MIANNSLLWRVAFFAFGMALFFPLEFAFSSPAEEAEALFEEGKALNEQRLFDDAIIQFSQAVKLDLENNRYHSSLLRTYTVSRRLPQGISFYKVLIRENPKHATIHYWLGRFYLANRALEKSAREFEKATRLNPEDEHAFISLGHVNSRLNKDEEGLKAYLQADALVPDVPVVQVGIGNLYFKKKEFDKAQNAYLIALEKDSSFLEARYNLGVIYEKKGEYGEAGAQYRMMLEEDPNEHAARERLAKLYFRAGFYGDAVREYATLSLVKLESVRIFLALGQSQVLLAAQLDDDEHRKILRKRARESFERVLELTPDNEMAKEHLAQLKRVESTLENKGQDEEVQD